MPEIDGFEVLRSIRQFEDDFNLERHKRVKIVVISTFNDRKTVTKARKAGCNSYIAKPFNKDKVLKTIEGLGLIEYTVPDPDDD